LHDLNRIWSRTYDTAPLPLSRTICG